MTFATHIGSGLPLFILPGGKFINATKPLALMAAINPEKTK